MTLICASSSDLDLVLNCSFQLQETIEKVILKLQLLKESAQKVQCRPSWVDSGLTVDSLFILN